MCGAGSSTASCLRGHGLSDGTDQGNKRHAHVFKVTAHQLNIFMGGHMRAGLQNKKALLAQGDHTKNVQVCTGYVLELGGRFGLL